MIAYLSGTLADKGPDTAIIDVHGVGYLVRIPSSTQSRLGDTGHTVKLLTILVIRENSQELYGFLTTGERGLFEKLISVSGVGPKLALSILSSMSPDGFAQAILTNDSKSLSKVPGVGKKTAERLIMELKGSFDSLDFGLPETLPDASAMGGPQREAVMALESLGFKQSDAAIAVSEAARKLGDIATSDVLVKEALRKI